MIYHPQIIIVHTTLGLWYSGGMNKHGMLSDLHSGQVLTILPTWLACHSLCYLYLRHAWLIVSMVACVHCCTPSPDIHPSDAYTRCYFHFCQVRHIVGVVIVLYYRQKHVGLIVVKRTDFVDLIGFVLSVMVGILLVFVHCCAI